MAARHRAYAQEQIQLSEEFLASAKTDQATDSEFATAHALLAIAALLADIAEKLATR